MMKTEVVVMCLTQKSTQLRAESSNVNVLPN